MNLKQALYITTIAREGSVTAAAKKLYISQPSLSQMLRQVEGELEVELFDRSAQPLRPTYAGERYLHAAAILLNTNETLDNELREIRQENSGRLRLGISMQRSARLLPQVLPQFVKEFPLVRLELREAGSAMLEQMVLDREVDLAFASTQGGLPGLSYYLIQRETIGILAACDTPLARTLPSGTPIHLEQAMDAPFVSLKPGHNARVVQDRLFRERNLSPTLFLESDSMEAARQITVSCGCYMLCAHSYAAGQGSFYPLADYHNQRHFLACCRQGQHLPRYVPCLIQLVIQALSPQQHEALESTASAPGPDQI